MRLIDADALYSELAKANSFGELTAKKAIRRVANEPTVDAEPVRHGHWIDMGDFESCSVCHSTHLKEFQSYYGKVEWVKTPYCPYCGAKMDAERKEE